MHWTLAYAMIIRQEQILVDGEPTYMRLRYQHKLRSPLSQNRLTDTTQQPSECLVPDIPSLQNILGKCWLVHKRHQPVLMLHMQIDEEADITPGDDFVDLGNVTCGC